MRRRCRWFLATSFGDDEQGGEHDVHRDHAEQESDARDHPELPQATEVGREGEEEDARAGRGPEHVATARGRDRLPHRSLDRAAARPARLPAGHDVHAVVQSDADEHQHEHDRQQVQSADKERRGTVRPTERDRERDDHEQRTPPAVEGADEDQGDDREGGRGAAGHVRVARREFVGLQDRLAGDADLDAGVFGGDLVDHRSNRRERLGDRGERAELLSGQDLDEAERAAGVREQGVAVIGAESHGIRGKRRIVARRAGDRAEQHQTACAKVSSGVVGERERGRFGETTKTLDTRIEDRRSRRVAREEGEAVGGIDE